MFMNSAKAIDILKRQSGAAISVARGDKEAPLFSKWHRDTKVAIERIFGPQSSHVSDFEDVRYSLGIFTTDTPDYVFAEARRDGLRHAATILDSMIDEITEYGLPGEAAAVEAPDALVLIEKLCLRFHAAARQLRHRHSDRPTLTITDEYDVQDLLHTILRLHFDDVRPEEHSPSYAGRGSRVDFLLKAERVVIEVKKTRPSLKAGDLGEELIVDRARYQAHPGCDTLVCFVYDPDGLIDNPRGIEDDLEGVQGTLRTRVIIAPRHEPR